MNITNKKKILSLCLAALFICIMMISVLFIVIHSEHNCTGEDCPICYAIHISQEALKVISCAAILTTFGNIFIFRKIKSTLFLIQISNITTLFSLKVKLNN